MDLKIRKILVCLSFLFLIQVIPGFSLESQLLKSNFSEENYNQVQTVFNKKVETAFYKNDASSSYTEVLSNFIKETILPYLESKESFLDIGAGPGEITNQIAPHFNSSTIVEPNSLHKEKYTAQKCTVHTANFQDVQLKQKYDFVLCAHVLYFIEHNKWAEFLEKLHSCINKNGQGLVVLVAPRGNWHKLRESINPNYSNSALVEKKMDMLNIKCKKTPNHNTFSTADYDEFKRIVYLFTITDCFTSLQDFKKLTEGERNSIFAKIDAFIEDCRTDDGRYEAICEDDCLLFSVRT